VDAYITEAVLAIVKTVKQTGDDSLLPILADALEDAGFADRRAAGWSGPNYPDKTVLKCLRRGERCEIAARYLTPEERAALAAVGLGGAKGVSLRTDGMRLHSAAYQITAAAEVTVSGLGWECDWPLTAFVARRQSELRAAEEARERRTADDLLTDPRTVELLDNLIETGRAYSAETDRWARRPVVREARARREAATA
jgi:hypothetical protein